MEDEIRPQVFARLHDVVGHEGEAILRAQPGNVSLGPSVEVVDAEDVIAALKQGSTQVRTDESSAARDYGVQLLPLLSPSGAASRTIYCDPIRCHK